MSDLDALARDVLALSRRLGSTADSVEVLWDQANVVLRVGQDLIARVATVTRSARGERSVVAMTRSLVVADRLREMSVPAPRPASAVSPGPHACGSAHVTFWEHLDHDASRPLDATVAATRLQALHDALADCPREGFARLTPLAELPPMIRALRDSGTVTESELDRLDSELFSARERIDDLALPETLLHGDASPGNLLRTPIGPIWSDFEDACVGPVAWDLACLVGTARAFDLPSLATREAILGAYGPPEDTTLRPFVAARVVQALIWDATISAANPERASAASARRARHLST